MRPPDSWKTARVTVGIAVAIFAAWLIEGFVPGNMWAAWGAFIPADWTFDFDFARAPFWLTPLTATLLHANFAHLLLNLIIHLFCGRAVEGVLGPVGLAILYVAGAYAAAGAHWLVDPESLVPMIGASGAVSAVLGAYALLFGRNKVKAANPRVALWLNALWLVAAWVGLQVLVGLTFREFGVGIAVAAHIGGFLAGLMLANPLLLLRYRRA